VRTRADRAGRDLLGLSVELLLRRRQLPLPVHHIIDELSIVIVDALPRRRGLVRTLGLRLLRGRVVRRGHLPCGDILLRRRQVLRTVVGSDAVVQVVIRAVRLIIIVVAVLVVVTVAR
jgi:hypothetical protein